MTLVCSVSARACTHAWCTHTYARGSRLTERETGESGFRSRRAVLAAVCRYSRAARLRRRYIHDGEQTRAIRHGPPWWVSAVPALISGKPPQIRPANSASLSLIVAKEDSDGEGKGKRSRASPFGTAAAKLSYRTIASPPRLFSYFFSLSPPLFSPQRAARPCRKSRVSVIGFSIDGADLSAPPSARRAARKGKFRGTSRNAGRMETAYAGNA